MQTIKKSTLWQEIVAITANLGPDARAMRIPLLVELRQPPRSLRERMAAAIKLWAPFLALPHKTIAHNPRGRVLFCFPHRTASTINNLLPVVREAHRRGLPFAILTAEDLSTELKEFVGEVPITSLPELVRQLDRPERMRLLLRVAHSYKQITKALKHHFQELRVAGHRARLIRELVGCVFCSSVCERLLEDWSPSCVVSTNDFWPLGNQLGWQASQRHIRSFVIQHGVIDAFWWPFASDVYCLWGDAHADQMRRLGTPEERMIVLGMPATDKLFERAKLTQYRPVEKRPRPICLILSQTNGSAYEPDVFRSYRQFLADAIRLMPSVIWKVKFHPVEDDSFYRDMGDTIYERLTFYDKDASLEETVNDADFVTTTFSTAGLEAMAMDRPVIVAPATPRVQELAWWPQMGGGTYAASAQEFQLQANNLIANTKYRTQQLEQQRQFLSKCFANQGHAAERIVDLLQECSERQGPSQNQLRIQNDFESAAPRQLSR